MTEPELDAYVTFAERGTLTGRAIACQWWDRELGREQIDDSSNGDAGPTASAGCARRP